jgi:hypothetical protein
MGGTLVFPVPTVEIDVRDQVGSMVWAGFHERASTASGASFQDEAAYRAVWPERVVIPRGMVHGEECARVLLVDTSVEADWIFRRLGLSSAVEQLTEPSPAAARHYVCVLRAAEASSARQSDHALSLAEIAHFLLMNGREVRQTFDDNPWPTGSRHRMKDREHLFRHPKRRFLFPHPSRETTLVLACDATGKPRLSECTAPPPLQHRGTQSFAVWRFPDIAPVP